MKPYFRIWIVSTDSNDCLLLNGDFGTSPSCWQLSARLTHRGLRLTNKHTIRRDSKVIRHPHTGHGYRVRFSFISGSIVATRPTYKKDQKWTRRGQIVMSGDTIDLTRHRSAGAAIRWLQAVLLAECPLWVISGRDALKIPMSALPPKADIRRRHLAVSFGNGKTSSKKGAGGSWGRAARARTRSGDGEGWGRDRTRVTPFRLA